MTQTVQPKQAALFIVAGMAALGLTDNFVPFVSAQSSLWQFHLVRGGLVLLALFGAAFLGAGRLWPHNPLGVLGRSLFLAGSMLIYFGCVAIMPIGVVVAGLFTAPLFVVIISVVFQRKSVGPVRWFAVLVGFLGTLLVIAPNPAALDYVSFLPVLGGLLYAVGAIATRAWCEGEAVVTLSAWFFGALTCLGAVGVLLLPSGGALGAEGFPIRGWMPMTGSMMMWYLALATGALIGIGCIFRGYQLGEASYVAVFEYTLLIFASVWAWVLWDQTVSPLGMLGMAMITFAGSVIAFRSDQAQRG